MCRYMAVQCILSCLMLRMQSCSSLSLAHLATLPLWADTVSQASACSLQPPCLHGSELLRSSLHASVCSSLLAQCSCYLQAESVQPQSHDDTAHASTDSGSSSAAFHTPADSRRSSQEVSAASLREHLQQLQSEFGHPGPAGASRPAASAQPLSSRSSAAGVASQLATQELASTLSAQAGAWTGSGPAQPLSPAESRRAAANLLRWEAWS